MDNETVISFLNDVKDDSLILIHVFNEPYQFIKQNINYDVTKNDCTLAIQTIHDKRVFLINIEDIKSMSILTKEQYTNNQSEGVI